VEDCGRGVFLMDTLLHYIYLGLYGIASMLVGALIQYLNKKGENRAVKEDQPILTEKARQEESAKKEAEIAAIHADIATVVADARATRDATARIEATVSHEMWGQQRAWDLKRDIALDAMRVFGEIQQLVYSIFHQLRPGESYEDISTFLRFKARQRP
jgi:hypothetical protein